MAKDLGLLDNGRCKIGNVVLQRNNVQRVRQTIVKNPRTQGQIIQRVIMATAAGMASGLKGIVNHSFENIPYGGKSVAEFRKLALKALRAQAKADLEKARAEQQGCFLPYHLDACLPNEVIISRGSLPYDGEYLPSWYNNDLQMMLGHTLSVEGMTASEWWWYFFGMVPGRQLTWIFMGYDANEPDQENCIYSAVPFQVSVYEDANRHIKTPLVQINRLVLKQDSPNYAQKLLPTMTRQQAVTLLLGCIDTEKSDAIFSTLISDANILTWTVEGESVEMAMSAIKATSIPNWDESVICAAGIHSELVGGKWKRTTSKLQRTKEQFPVLTGESIHHSPWQGLNISDAVASWLDAPKSAESDRYLNEGL